MKYLSEYRDPELVEELIKEINRITTKPWTLMEICGGQTHSLVKNGILEMLPQLITMVHGPGCPVCVTSVSVIDEAVYLADDIYIMKKAPSNIVEYIKVDLPLNRAIELKKSLRFLELVRDVEDKMLNIFPNLLTIN